MTYILTERLHGDDEGKLYIVARSRSAHTLRMRRAKMLRAILKARYSLRPTPCTRPSLRDLEIWKLRPRTWDDVMLEQKAKI